MTSWDLSQLCKDDSTFKRQLIMYSIKETTEQKSHNHINRCRESISQIQHPFLIETFSKLRTDLFSIPIG